MPTTTGNAENRFRVSTTKKIINMAISNIDNRGSWYDIYDERGKKAKTLSSNIGDIEGFSSDFFIVNRGSWYDLYDEDGKKYKTLSTNIGDFVSVSGNTFVVKRGSWLDTYDKSGKKINTRSAR
ncbi:MAG: hypothetical protein PHC38_01605 [Weeksellaceae bacterium]|nr:hypothetical protein [Weeksellaceae bacterium]